MSTELADDVGAELARLYAEWMEANATAASLLISRSPGESMNGRRLEELQRAEARAAALVVRYRAAASGSR